MTERTRDQSSESHSQRAELNGTLKGSSPAFPRAIDGLLDIAADYKALFCDVWGVLHNGVEKFPLAEAALCRVRAIGLPVVLVTNSPRRADDVASFLSDIGVSPDAFDAIATSGEVTRALIEASSPRLFHVGSRAQSGLFDGLNVEDVGEDRAEVVVVTGLVGSKCAYAVV
jgi:ribonucleotide monophosphatase NagD (HAD superfamily)